MQAGCLVMQLLSDNGTAASPLEAFLLALCQGSYDFITIQDIFARTLRKEKEQIVDFTSSAMNKFERYISWQDQAGLVNNRYDPVDFLYDPQPHPLTKQKRLESPAEIALVLTHACNFRCIYCFNGSGEPDRTELSTDEFLDIIDQAAELDVLKCTLTGGEPFLHPGFSTILKKVVDSKISPYVATNGSLISQQHIHTFADLGLSFIQISLDAGTPKTHDQMTATQGTFPKVVQAMKDCIAAGMQVYVKAVMTPLNLAEADTLVDLCWDIGVSQLLLDRYDPNRVGRGNQNLFLSQQQEQKLDELVKQKIPQIGDDMKLMAVTIPRCWSGPKDIISCGGLRTAMTILPNGDVTPCEKVTDNPNMIAGNVRKNSLKNIWISAETTAIVNPPPESLDEPCRSCEYLDGCGTGCYDQTMLCTVSPYAVDPRCWKSAYKNSFYQDYIMKSV